MALRPKYEEVLEEARRMDSREQLRLLEDLAAALRREMKPTGERSILELEGLGEEVWNGGEAQEYVDRERGTWAGQEV